MVVISQSTCAMVRLSFPTPTLSTRSALYAFKALGKAAGDRILSLVAMALISTLLSSRAPWLRRVPQLGEETDVVEVACKENAHSRIQRGLGLE